MFSPGRMSVAFGLAAFMASPTMCAAPAPSGAAENVTAWMHEHDVARMCVNIEVSDRNPATARLLTSMGDATVDAEILEVVRAAGTTWRSAEGRVVSRYTKSPQQISWVFWGGRMDAKGAVLGCAKTSRH
jgi:hypothetical protein